MRKSSSRGINRIVIGLTVLIFLLGYLLVVRADVSEAKGLLSFLVASYLIIWGGYSLVSPISRHEIRIRFVLITLSLGVALFLLELPAGLQLMDYKKLFSISGAMLWEQPGYLPDLELLGKPEPHRSVKMVFNRGNIGEVLCLPRRQAEPFEVKYDRNGFRNDEDLPRAEIAVIGDSYVESQMIPGRFLATSRLSEITGTTVANLGQSGFGPQQELAVLKRYALPLGPRFVVWVFYEGNDLADAREYAEMVSLLKAKSDSMEWAWNRSFSKNFLSWLMRVSRGCVPATNVPAVAATVIDKDGTEHRVYVKGRSMSPSFTNEDLDGLKKSVEAIEEAYRLVQREGSRLIVVFAPTAFRVYHDIARFEREGKDAPRWTLDDLPERLRYMVSKISPDIDYLDLTPALKSAAKKGLMFLSDDTHWSTEGHEVVAEAIAETIAVRNKFQAHNDSHALPEPHQDLVLGKDALMVRNVDGTIRYWSKGAEHLYGWSSSDALGMTSHRLLETVFPVPLEAIEDELRMKGYWEGKLIHRRRDGSRIAVSSHWDLQQNPTSHDQSITVIEVNNPSNS